MNNQQNEMFTIYGKVNNERVESRILEERIQEAVSEGRRQLKIVAYGQHGIGGRLWKSAAEPIYILIDGQSGQRAGSMGFTNTCVEINGPASDDVGWLNAGAEIVVHGNAGNGAGNAMAQGKIYIAGNIGSRGMTMTKYNPKFDPPEMWMLGSVGDYFGEFMAGGIAVVCGIEPQDPTNVLGYRPLVGMVGGKIYFRGPHKGYSQQDSKLIPISDTDWDWFTTHLKLFLDKIHRPELFDTLSKRDQWQLLKARSPQEKFKRPLRSIKRFRSEVWNKELEKWGKDLGRGGIYGDIDNLDRSQIPVITNGELRRYVPVWENRMYLAPCQASCPTGIPVHDRWRLVREGRIEEALDIALAYTPFPATICGYLCPNLCMQACTRQTTKMPSVDITKLGQASINAGLPKLPETMSGKKIAIIGGGPSGISVAWQLRQKGHDAVVYDMAKSLGGKLASAIPGTRIPQEIISAELERIKKVIPHINLQQKLTINDFDMLKGDYDFVVIAIGAQKPRIIPMPGKERLITALDFLTRTKGETIKVGNRVAIIGAGNVGCDVATEAYRLGARDITLLDIQEPLSFGKERDAAEAIGAKFQWPVMTKEITEEGVKLATGEVIPADTVIISIGDAPDLDFLPKNIETDRGFIKVNTVYQTTDPKIFAIGDVVKPGLLTDAIGAGRKAANAIHALVQGNPPVEDTGKMIDKKRVSLEYFDPRITEFKDVLHCGSQCSSCGACRDCGICVSVCPKGAIHRIEKPDNDYEYTVDEKLCIGCGFCAGACPCGIWNLVENAMAD